MQEPAGESKRSVIVSAVSEGTLIETIYRQASEETALVIARGGVIEIAPQWQADGISYRPVRGSNNLVKHRALLFAAEPLTYSDTEGLLGEIEDYIRRFVILPEEALGLSSAYILLSWVYDAFNELPYLRFRGDYGTGKTRALLVIGSLCYKAFFASGASTVSPIFHTLDTFKGTLIFDEADFRFTDEKAELVKILNNGNSRGFPVLRTQMTAKKEFDPRAFAIFGPKIVGMRRSYEDRALESRFLTIDMEPGRSAGVPINLPDEQSVQALQLRNKLLMYRLRNRLLVALDVGLVDPQLESRMNQILLPLLSVVPDEKRRTLIRKAASALQAETESDRGTSTEGQLLSVLARLLEEHPEAHLPLAEITSAFATEHGSDYDRPITNRWIGSVLRRLGITLYKSNGVVVLRAGQEDRLHSLFERYGIGRT